MAPGCDYRAGDRIIGLGQKGRIEDRCLFASPGKSDDPNGNLESRLAEWRAAFANSHGQVKKIIDSGALGKILTSTVNASASMLTDAPEKYYYLNDPTSGM